MAKFVLVYTGGGGMAMSPEEQQKVMETWTGWFGTLGDAVIDSGNPFGAGASIAAGGSVQNSGASDLGGYSIIAADSLTDATEKAKGCPILEAGGNVDIYQTLEM
jgi:hypothetical protein